MKNRQRKIINLIRLGLGSLIVATLVFSVHVAAVKAQSTRLEAAQLHVCQNREAAINLITARLASRASRQVIVFSSIAQRVEHYYVQKGNTIPTYDALAADVTAKKLTAQTHAAALTTSAIFSCTADDPKGLVGAFKGNLQTTQSTLQDYKTAIKNLIVGVRSAQGQSSNQNVNGVNLNAQ